ncbi:MAG: hypothetical protein V4726_11195 [Verrucomicrobiota bacterium]
MFLAAQTFSNTQPPIAPPVAGPQAGDTPDMLLAKIGHVLAGGSGCRRFSDTAPHAYPMLGFYCLTETVIASATGLPGYDYDASVNATALPAGSLWPFRLATVTLTSGSILAIKA